MLYKSNVRKCISCAGVFTAVQMRVHKMGRFARALNMRARGVRVLDRLSLSWQVFID